ncbi:PDIA5 isomerase, partial [Polypterus senegalus]
MVSGDTADLNETAELRSNASALWPPSRSPHLNRPPRHSQILFAAFLDALKVSPLIEKVSEHKDFKKLLRTRTNVLILYSKSAAAGERQLKLLSEVAQAVKGQGTIAWVDCGDSEGRKLCKKVKVDPSSKKGSVEMLHYKDGNFNTEYNRPETFKSIVAFLKDPTGAPLWEENPEAKDITHIESERVLAGMNVHPAEFDGIKQEFNVKGYPTFCYFEKGKFLHHYENYGATAKDIAEWMKNPEPPHPKTPEVPWSEQESAVFHLTDEDFDKFLQDHPKVLVMFYAPWCGHCKKMKPDYDEAAEVLNKDEHSPGVLAAVDATIHKVVAEKYHVSGFPTVKYFEDGEEKFTLPHLRTKDKIIEWLHNPQAPPPPEQSWEEKPSHVSHLAAEDFKDFLKKKKHALVMFYAPWCPHCKNAVPHFTLAADLFKEDRKIAYAAVDCTKGQNHEVCKQEGVEGYPTFNYYNYGKFGERYSGERGVRDGLCHFHEDTTREGSGKGGQEEGRVVTARDTPSLCRFSRRWIPDGRSEKRKWSFRHSLACLLT